MLSDVDTKYLMGWVNIGWLVILMGTNFFWMIGIQISQAYLKLKRMYFRNRIGQKIRKKLPRKFIEKMKTKFGSRTTVEILPNAR